MHDLAFIFAGFFVGFVVGLTGVGGGSLMTPILIFFFGIKPYLAVGTDLLFAAFTKMSGTIKLARARSVDWRVVFHLSAGSIPAALVTLWVLHVVGPASPQVQAAMTTTLGVAAVEMTNPDMVVGTTPDGKPITVRDELARIRKEAFEGTDMELGAGDADLVSVAANCALTNGG